MDADRNGKAFFDEASYTLHIVREAPAVCVAKAKAIRAALIGRFQRAEGIVRVGTVAVEEMLRIVDYFFALRFEKTHGVPNHREVFR